MLYGEEAENKEIFKQYIENSDLSPRTANVLSDNVGSIQELMELDENQLKGFDRCGKKIIREILEFQKKMIDEFGDVSQENAQKELSDSIKEDIQFYDSVKQELSKRAQNVIINNEIDSLKKFMALTDVTLFQIQNCGRKTVAEIKGFQRKIYEIRKHHSQDILPSNLTDSEIENYSEFSDDNSFFNDNSLINVDAPFTSIEKWVSELARKFLKKHGQARRAFMLRMGMLGEPPMTLEQIGEKTGKLTRERIRQIINKMEKTGKHQIRRKKLQPLIEKALEIVNSRGGKIRKTTLVSLLLVRGQNGKMLKFATPFIDFLSTLQEWKDAGLELDENGIVFTDKSDEIIALLMSVITDIAKQNADEIIADDLWSTDYSVLKQKLIAWYSRKYTNKKLVLSETIIENALTSCNLQIRERKNRIYSNALWNLYFQKIAKAAETVLSRSGKMMHFSEIHHELTKYRPSGDTFTKRSVHATLDRNENVFLWERGSFIHKTCVTIPRELISRTEKWILRKLKEDVPFIAIYGTFQFFERRCIASDIPNEVALYSILKESSHPLIDYPRLPYICLRNGKKERVPSCLAVEQFLQDAERAVSYDEIKSFVIDKLFLKNFQFNQIIYQIPNTIRTHSKKFLHTDFLNSDERKFEEIVEYTRNVISTEEHISVFKIFKDKRVNCKILGIDDAMGLFSLFKIKVDDEFDLQYPQIRRISEEDFHKKRGLRNEVISFIKEKKKVCSYHELQDIFVDKLGYSENTLRYIVYQKSVCKYLKNCYVHKDTLEWNDEKQEQIEKIASDRYDECVKAERCYGLVKDMTEFDDLPDLPDLKDEIYWTPFLLADLLVSRDKFKILGNEKNAFVSIPNQFGIENFEGLVYEILRNDYDGEADLIFFADYLRELEIIRKNITESMLGKSEKVKIIGDRIILSELLEEEDEDDDDA